MIPRLALIAWILVLVLLILGAYLRHSQAGSGCSEWPKCYGRISATLGSNESPTAQREIAQPRWATRSHRAVAGLIAVVVVAITALSVIRRKRGAVLLSAFLALANLLFLIALGLWAGGSRSPLVTVGNLLGGVALLGILWWLYLTSRPLPKAHKPPSRPVIPLWMVVGLMLAFTVITLGAFSSAIYAGVACEGFPACSGVWWPRATPEEIFSLFRPLPTDDSGVVIGGPGQTAVQLTHRMGAVVLLVWGIAAGWRLTTAGTGAQGWSIALLVLTGVQIMLGISVAIKPSVLATALAHNLAASLLLIALLHVLHHHLSTRLPTNSENPQLK